MIDLKEKCTTSAALCAIIIIFLLITSTAFADSDLSTTEEPHSDLTQKSSKEHLSQKENNLAPIYLLNSMQKAITTSNYQFYFYTENDFFPFSDANTFLYEHRYELGNEQARLTNQDSSEKNIILNHQIVSYFQKDAIPFSLSAHYIVDVFPDVLYADFLQLNQYYQFNFVGKSRIANKMAQIVQIIPKQNDRYSYLLWIDEATALPLRIDLLNLNAKILHQFKVIQFSTDPSLNHLKQDIEKINFPTAISEEPSMTEPSLEWTLNWQPQGFKEKSASHFYHGDNELYSKLYSDGVFSFLITVSDKKEANNEINIDSITSIYAASKQNKNIVIIGSLPLSTLKKIVDNLSF